MTHPFCPNWNDALPLFKVKLYCGCPHLYKVVPGIDRRHMWLIMICFFYVYRIQKMIVVAGDYSLSIYEGTEQEILPQLLVPHPDYNATTNNSDIMLIKVQYAEWSHDNDWVESHEILYQNLLTTIGCIAMIMDDTHGALRINPNDSEPFTYPLLSLTIIIPRGQILLTPTDFTCHTTTIRHIWFSIKCLHYWLNDHEICF